MQIGGGNASKFDCLMLGMFRWSSGSWHFLSKNGRKRKVLDSFKTCSCDILGARRVLLSDFQSHQWLMDNFWKSCIFAIFKWFLVATRMVQCYHGFHWGVLRTSSCARSTGAATLENGAKHPSWGPELENGGVIGNRWWKPGFWAFWHVKIIPHNF